MLNKIYREINKYAGENELPNDIDELRHELDPHFVEEYVDELIADSMYVVVNSKYFVKVATNHFVKFAEFLGASNRLQWHADYIAGLTINEGYSHSDMAGLISDLIIRNDLLTTNP